MSEVAKTSSRLRVYRRSPTENERWLLNNNIFEGAGLLLASIPHRNQEPPTVVEEALMAEEHPYIRSELARHAQVVVSAQAIARTLRHMWPIDQPDSLQYVHSAEAFVDMSEVFVVPLPMVEKL